MNEKIQKSISSHIENSPEEGKMLISEDVDVDEVEQWVTSNFPSYKFNINMLDETESGTFFFIKYKKV